MKYFNRLIPYLKKYYGLILLVIIMILLSSVLSLVPPWLTRYIVDNIIKENKTELLGLLVVIMIGLTLLQGSLDFLVRYIMEYVGQGVIHNLRTDLYIHLSRLSFSFYDQARVGDIVSRVTADADTLKRFLGFGSIKILNNIITLIGILVVMISWDYRLTIIYLLIVPLIIHAMYNYANKVRPVFGQSRKRLGKLNSRIRDSLHGIELIKIFGNEGWELDRFNKQNQSYYNLNVKGSRITSFWMPYVNFIIGTGIGLVVLLGGIWVIEGRISLGTLIGLISYMLILGRPIRQTGMIINMASKSIAALKRIFSIREIESEVKEIPEARPLPPVKGEVVFEKVNFSYNDGKKVLKDINFRVEPGQTVALVGPTGAGKTTLAHLIPRFYDPDQGRILIDGFNIREARINSLREQVGIVMQDTFLFGTTIAENISFGRPEAGMKEIVEAAKVAQIHDFIMSLPDGYYSEIGERGVKLSGGQRQRISIARTLLTDPRILIMDEPTSSVDAETEEKLNIAFSNIMKGRTTFIIAHRLWTVMNADIILVLKDGVIVEKGTHQELMNLDGVYSNMFKVFNKYNEGDMS